MDGLQEGHIVLIIYTSIIVLIAISYIFISLYRKRKQLKEENMRIHSIMENLGYFPMDMAEEFFERGGMKIKDKKMINGSHYDILIIESEKRSLEKYGHVPVKCFNTIEITFEDINFPDTFFDNSKDRLAVIIVPENLSVKNKFHIGDIRNSSGLIIAHLTLDDVKNALFDEYSGKETDGSGIRSLINDRINMAEAREDLYYYTKKVTDPVMFYGRKELCKNIISDLNIGINTGIFGLRKIGKSSLNMYLQRQLRKYDHFYPVVISLQRSTATVKGIFEDIMKGLMSEIKGKTPDIQLPLTHYDVKFDEDPEEIARFFKQYMLNVKKILPEHSKVVLFIDEIDLIIPEESNRENDINFYTVFSTIRGISEIDNFLFMIVQGFDSKINSTNKFAKDLPDNPVFQFFREINISGLVREESDSLIEGIGAMIGINYTEENLAQIYREAGGHPFLTRLICSALVNILKENDKIVAVSNDLIEMAVNHCLENHTDYFRYIDSILEEKGEDYSEITSGKSGDKLRKLGILNDKNEVIYNIYKRWMNMSER